MRTLFRSIPAVLLFIATIAVAGPNENGYLLFHTDGTIMYTSDESSYCDVPFLECPMDFDGPPYDFESKCQASLTQIEPTSDRGHETAIGWVLAAFLPGSAPRVTGVTLGLNWSVDNELTIVDFGPCGNFELPDGDWPHNPRSGTAVTWNETQTTQALEVYWFAAYSYYGPLAVDLVPHHSQGGLFSDDSVPSVLDDIVDYGSWGLNGAEGNNPFPYLRGACCLPDGECVIETVGTCEMQGGSYLGDGSSCDSNPCEVSPTIRTSWGKLKDGYRRP